ncbi:MAG: integrase domain-containing protein [Paraglaciecola polaris]|uniref:integrase domain-containing protein n=1 Tax=Paraglaciecola polaris TaxID=222814 RepID=UPI003001A9FA|tara:strand:- start:3836 stop:5074 length:1239 start_codon:yes stop_codon:yes gene_type:complete
MARRTTALTNTEVDKAKPKDKVYKLADGEGLQLRIKPNGSKTWLFDYFKPISKTRTSISFGAYPEVSLKTAREHKVAARELLAKDIDPKEHRDNSKQIALEAHSNTLKTVAKEWLKIKQTKVTDDYAIDVWRSLELHVFPHLGNKPIDQITAPMTISVIKPVSAKGSLETVRRLCQRLNEIMIFANNTGLIHANPLSGITHAFETPKKKHLPTLKPNEIRKLMFKLSTASIKLTTRCLIEWQLNTMVRPSEAAGAKWAEIDIENKLWVIPAERMKKRKEHIVPLTQQTMALLDVIRPISEHREYIFPADRNPRTPCNSQTANMALKRMGFEGQLVSHGLRALASTTLNEQGFDADVIEAALAHVDQNEVRRAYNRSEYIEQRRALMAWWSQHIEEASTMSVSLASKIVIDQN